MIEVPNTTGDDVAREIETIWAQFKIEFAGTPGAPKVAFIADYLIEIRDLARVGQHLGRGLGGRVALRMAFTMIEIHVHEYLAAENRDDAEDGQRAFRDLGDMVASLATTDDSPTGLLS